MTGRETTAVDEVRRIVRRINELWLSGEYEAIGELLEDDAVVAPPGSDTRIRGRASYVDSYREYDRAATTREFSADRPQVDVVGDVAVAVCPFSIVYELGEETCRERGRDLLILSRQSGAWRVAWRTMQTEPVASDSRPSSESGSRSGTR